MTDETNPGQSPDGAQNTGNPQGNPQDNQPVPYDRFKAVIAEKNAAMSELEKLRKSQAERDEKDRLARGEHEQIIADLKPKAEHAQKLEAAMEEIFTLELQGVPEDMRALIPQGDVSTRLTWLKTAKNLKVFEKPNQPVTDAGATGSPANPVKLTDEERAAAKMAGMTDEQYAKHKTST